ncbi:MAG: hypothetical protein COA91_06145 [Robiginitomaculum sp.]|nr:MAG: hypothetical protein COA91_06145 [Robiginitomaculum sp.]
MRYLILMLASIFLILGLASCAEKESQTNTDNPVDISQVNLDDFGVADADRVVTSRSSEELMILVNVAGLGKKFTNVDNQIKSALIQRWVEEALAPVIARGEASLLQRVELYVISVEDMNEYGLSDTPFDLIANVEFQPKGDVLIAAQAKSSSSNLRNVLKTISVSTLADKGAGLFADFETRLNWPDAFYLLEGRPQSFYFESLILVEDIDSYFYVVDGRSLPFPYKARSRYVEFFPEAGDAGNYEIKLKIYSGDNKHIIDKTLKLVVSPAKCAAPTQINSLVIGHSLSTSWPLLWADKLRSTENLTLDALGGQKFVWKLPGTPPEMYEGIYLEASSGFSLHYILRKGENPPGYDPIKSKEQLKSPFVYKTAEGAFAVDMARYKKETLKNKNVNLVILNIGDNDTWGLNLTDPSQRLQRVKDDANRLIDHIKELSDNIVIGYMMTINYSHNQHSWLLDYKGKYNHWDQKQRRHLFIKAIRELQNERQDFYIIPTDFTVDGANDYYNFSAAHPPTEATSDYTEQIYAWTLLRGCSQ